MKKTILLASAATLAMSAFLPAIVLALPLTSPNYKLDPQGINAVGGQGSSTNYKMVSSGGEAVVGNGSGGSYKLSSGYVGQLQQSIELSLAESGVQAYYPLDTNIGIQAYDATTNNNRGVLSGGANWDSGKIGQGVDLTTSSDQISAPNAANLQLNSDLTTSIWVNPSTASQIGSSRVLSKGSTVINYMLTYASTGGKMRFIVDGDARTTATSTTAINVPGTWYHLVGVRDGDMVRIYINGVEEGTAAITGATLTNSNSLTLGGSSANGFIGTVDEAKVFNRALSAREVRSLYDANMAGITNAVSIPDVTPGVPQAVGVDMTVITDAGGYNAAISQNNNLTHSDTSTTIAAMSTGSIATPALWDDGITKGLGFTLTGGLSLPAKWGTGPVNYKYAAIPGTATTFFSRTGLSGGTKEVTNLRFKLDVPTSQKSGGYTNIATVTAVMKP